MKVIGNLTKDAIIRAAVSEGLTFTQAVGTPVDVDTVATTSAKITFDSSSNKVVVVYTDQGNTYQGKAVVGTVDPSNNSISFGTPVTFYSGEVGNDYFDVTFDSNSNKVVIAYQDVTDSNDGFAIVGTVSGTSISFGTAAEFSSDAVNMLKCTFDSNSNKVVIVYKNNDNSNYGTAVVGTVSGTSISFGSPVVFNSNNTSYPSPVFDTSNNKIVITYRNQSTTHGTAIVGTVSGTSISFGSATAWLTSGTDYQSIAFDSTNNKVIVVGNSSGGYAAVGTVSGTSISFGSAVAFTAVSPGSAEYNAAAFDSNTGKVVIVYKQRTTDDPALIVGEVSGTSISFGTAITLQGTDNTNGNRGITFDSNAKKIVTVYMDSSDNRNEAVVFQTAGSIATGGTIADGKAVIVNANGTVSTVGITDASIGSAVEFEDSGISYQNSAYDTANDKIVIVYTNTGNSNYLTAVVGTVSGTSVSFGTPVIVNSIQNYFPNIAFDENAGKFVITYSDTGNATHGRAVVATVSGTSITLGSHTSFASHNVQDTLAVYDSAAQKVVIAYRDGTNNNGKAIVGTISGTSITFGSAASFHSASTTHIGIAYDSSNNKIIFAYRDGNNSNQGTAVVGTVSGTSISFGSDAIFETTATQDTHVVYDSGNDKINIFYEDGSDSDKLKGVIGTVSGTSISFTSVQELYTDATVSGLAASYDVNAGKTVLSFRGASAYGYALPITSDGSTFTVGSSTIITNNAFGTQTSSVYDPDQKKVVIHYQDGDDSNHGKAQVYVAPASNAGSFVGFMKGAALDGTNGEILSSCSIARNQTSLTAGQTYFVSPTDGSLSTSAGSPSVTAGTAISSTEIIVKG